MPIQNAFSLEYEISLLFPFNLSTSLVGERVAVVGSHRALLE